MAILRTRPNLIILLIASALMLFMGGCKKPPVVQGIGVAVSQNGVSVAVIDAKLIRPEFEGLRGAVVSEHPVLELTVQLTNNSESPVTYDLGWNQTVSTQTQSIIVFAGSDYETDVSEANQISAVDLSDVSYLDDPVTSSTTVVSGDSLTDKILFAAPPEGTQSLLISIPPGLFHDQKLPAYITVPWQPNDVAPLETVGLGEVYEGGDFSLRVSAVTTEWVQLQDAANEVGISNEPLMKIAFELTNTSPEPVTYRPTRERGAVAFPTLLQPDGASVPRATFNAAVKVVGQKDTRQQVAAGESVEDFILFHRPAQGVESLRFIFPGKRIGGSGQGRVELSYQYANPQKPAEWLPPVEAEENGGE